MCRARAAFCCLGQTLLTYGPPGKCTEAGVDDVLQKDIVGVLQTHAPSLQQGESTLHGALNVYM